MSFMFVSRLWTTHSWHCSCCTIEFWLIDSFYSHTNTHTHRIWCTQHSDGPFQFWRYLWIATLWMRRPNVAGIVRLMYSNLEESKWINGTHDLNWAPKFVRKIPKSLAKFLTIVEMCRVLISSTQCDEISKEFTESEVFALKLLISDVP